MPFECKLTRSNIKQYKNCMLEVYHEWERTSVIYLAYSLLIWYFELFCSYHFIDSDDDVVWKEVEKRMKLKGNSRSFVYVLRKFRNIIIHEFGDSLNIKRALERISRIVTDKVVVNFCDIFEEDKEEFSECLINILKAINEHEYNCDNSSIRNKRISDF